MNKTRDFFIRTIPVCCVFVVQVRHQLGQHRLHFHRASLPLQAADLDLELKAIEKWAFYDAVATEDHILTVQTADQQRYANILLSIGVRMD